MKKIYIAALLLAAVSCTNRLDYHSGQPEKLLILNSVMRTDESLHRVNVWLSTLRESPKYLTDAKVDVYINGGYLGEAVFYDRQNYPGFPKNDYFGMAKMQFGAGFFFEATLSQGDEIRIEASWEELRASATVTVPPAVELVSLDTLSVDENPYSEGRSALECKLRMRDVPGQDNWMRLVVEQHCDVVSHHGNDPSNDTLRTWFTHPSTIYFDDDEVLRDCFHSSREQDALHQTDLNLPLVTNEYCIFTDREFRDSDYTADVYLNDASIYTPYPAPWPTDVNSSLTFKLLTISQDDYLYHRAYTNEKHNILGTGTAAKILCEPVTYPVNVEGGLGFVCVQAVSKATLDFSEKMDAMPEEGLF